MVFSIQPKAPSEIKLAAETSIEGQTKFSERVKGTLAGAGAAQNFASNNTKIQGQILANEGQALANEGQKLANEFNRRTMDARVVSQYAQTVDAVGSAISSVIGGVVDASTVPSQIETVEAKADNARATADFNQSRATVQQQTEQDQIDQSRANTQINKDNATVSANTVNSRIENANLAPAATRASINNTESQITRRGLLNNLTEQKIQTKLFENDIKESLAGAMAKNYQLYEEGKINSVQLAQRNQMAKGATFKQINDFQKIQQRSNALDGIRKLSTTKDLADFITDSSVASTLGNDKDLAMAVNAKALSLFDGSDQESEQLARAMLKRVNSANKIKDVANSQEFQSFQSLPVANVIASELGITSPEVLAHTRLVPRIDKDGNPTEDYSLEFTKVDHRNGPTRKIYPITREDAEVYQNAVKKGGNDLAGSQRLVQQSYERALNSQTEVAEDRSGIYDATVGSALNSLSKAFGGKGRLLNNAITQVFGTTDISSSEMSAVRNAQTDLSNILQQQGIKLDLDNRQHLIWFLQAMEKQKRIVDKANAGPGVISAP